MRAASECFSQSHAAIWTSKSLLHGGGHAVPAKSQGATSDGLLDSAQHAKVLLDMTLAWKSKRRGKARKDCDAAKDAWAHRKLRC